MRNNDILRALQNVGLTPVHGCNIVLDGRINRFDIEGRPRGKKHGWIIGHMDGGKAFAVFGDWKTGMRDRWSNFDPDDLSEDDRQAYLKRQAEIEETSKRERQRKAAQAANKATAMIRAARHVAADHPYILRKGIRPFGAYQLRDMLLIPVCDLSGAVMSLQVITTESKKFLSGGNTRGGCLVIGGELTAPILFLAEGWATSCSLHMATSLPVVVTFSAANMVEVAKRLAGLVKGRVIVCGDNDHATPGNPGKAAAIKAASLIRGARYVLPYCEEVGVMP